MKGLFLVFVLAFAANWLVERFVIKDPNDENDTGFIVAAPGLGWDDVARAAGIALVVKFGAGLIAPLLGTRKIKV